MMMALQWVHFVMATWWNQHCDCGVMDGLCDSSIALLLLWWWCGGGIVAIGQQFLSCFVVT